MTIYKTDFSEYTSDAAPSDWTEIWGTAGSLTVKDSTNGLNGKYLEYLQPSDTWTGFSWDDIDSDANRDDVEVLMFCHHTATTLSGTMIGPMVRASGTASNKTGYLMGAYGDTMFAVSSVGTLCQSVVNDSFTNLPPGVSQSPYNSNIYSTYRYWKRVRINGTSIKIRQWSNLIPEPEGWDLELTNSAVSGVGAVGLCCHNDSGDPYRIYYFCVATNGDTAEYPDATTAEVRVSAAPLQVLVEANPLPIQAAQTYVEVLTHQNSQVKAAQTYVEVLHTMTAEASSASSTVVACINT